MPKKLIVGYRTRAVPGMEIDVNTLTPPKTHKKEEAIAAWRAEQAEKLAAEMLRQPYTATFDELQIVDVVKNRIGTWKYEGREPGKGKPCVAAAAWAWLKAEYPGAWPHSSNPTRVGPPEVVFLGFEPRLFLKILGIDCTLPLYQAKTADGKVDPRKLTIAPLGLWYANSDHRDISEAVMPNDFKFLDWPLVLKARGLTEKYKDWKGPHIDVTMDVNLTTDLASQLGMLAEDDG